MIVQVSVMTDMFMSQIFSRVREAERGSQDELVSQLCPNIAGASGVSISCKYLIG